MCYTITPMTQSQTRELIPWKSHTTTNSEKFAAKVVLARMEPGTSSFRAHNGNRWFIEVVEVSTDSNNINYLQTLIVLLAPNLIYLHINNYLST